MEPQRKKKQRIKENEGESAAMREQGGHNRGKFQLLEISIMTKS